MLFKPWLEGRHPRHELHDDSSSDEDQPIVSDLEDEAEDIEQRWKHSIGKFLKPTVTISFASKPEIIEKLVVVSPALATIILSLGDSTKVGLVEVSNSSRAAKHEIFFLEPYKFYWLKLPHSPEVDCYSVAKELLDTLQPKLVVQLVPSFPDSDGFVFTLATENAPDISKKYPGLKPPHFITNIQASILSYAELKNYKALALIVRADGVPDHEFVEEDVVEDTVKALELVLGDGSRWKIDHKRLRRTHFRSTGMYV
ncbi:hypothetical protein V1514DRAFT_325729 [Lipomyces japonicus]|uniref:uncharacterized protein n=1 Tax=Lipomyces japonicus TaxID=56871 RepID=UPI0034D00C06